MVRLYDYFWKILPLILSSNIETQGELGAQEVRNERALFVFNRVQHKLTGMLLMFGERS